MFLGMNRGEERKKIPKTDKHWVFFDSFYFAVIAKIRWSID
jgi:hypothetical protein